MRKPDSEGPKPGRKTLTAGYVAVATGILVLFLAPPGPSGPTSANGGDGDSEVTHIYVDARSGRAGAQGTMKDPLGHVGEALDRLPDPVETHHVIHVARGVYRRVSETSRNVLRRRMSPLGSVRLVGEKNRFTRPAGPGAVVFDWRTIPIVKALEGHWCLENIQLGTRQKGQSGGAEARGSATLLELKNVRIRTGSFSGLGLTALRGARMHLYGTIELNDDLKDENKEDHNRTFCGISAAHQGMIEFKGREKGSQLIVGDGSVGTAYWGVVRLGCKRALVNTWTHGNNMNGNNSGRVELNGTDTILRTRNPKNNPIGPEDDGHIDAEGSHLLIDSAGAGIILQKVSSFFADDLEFRGKLRGYMAPMSHSVLVASVRGDLGRLQGWTGGSITIEGCTGRIVGPIRVSRGASVALPDGKLVE